MSNKNLDITNIEKELSNIIGLESVKKAIIDICQTIIFQEKSKESGETDGEPVLNFMFLGNPGTGKTTIARVLSKCLNHIGVLKTGKIIEVGRMHLVSPYIGKTSEKVEEVFNEAIGGVLIIDNLSSLGHPDDSFGQEAIDTLLKLIEDHAGELVVILDGYEKELLDFIDMNPGLDARFPEELRIRFPDYSEDELYRIGMEMLKNQGFEFSNGSSEVFESSVKKLTSTPTREFGNGRIIRNHVEEIIRRHALRIASNDVSDEEINRITKEDIEEPSMSDEEFDIDKELGRIIGLHSVKERINELYAVLTVQEKRRKAGINVEIYSHIFTFFGNPGTGKTTIAGVLAKMFKATGVLSRGHLVTASRKDLVGEYIGQTATKVERIFRSALGGVLFIDEIYTLSCGDGNDFGKEAINALMMLYHDTPRDIVIILAGYEDEMMNFIEVNSAIDAKIPISHRIHFPDYTPQELLQMSKNAYNKSKHIISEETEKTLLTVFENAVKNPNFVNGRFVRNLYEKSLENQAIRLRSMSNLVREDYLTILPEDISKNVPLNKKEDKPYVKVSREIFDGLDVLFDVNEAIRNKSSLSKATDNAILFVKTDKGAGTAFLISPEGYALTCNHVIEGANEINARLRIPGRFGGDDSFHKCEVINTRKDLDIALIKLEGYNFPYLPIAAEDRVIEKGEDFILSGYPFGDRTAKDITLLGGIVASSQGQQDGNGITRYNINCEAKSHNSGAPIISLKDGCVIGLLLGTITEKFGQLSVEINYMRPINYFWEEFLS